MPQKPAQTLLETEAEVIANDGNAAFTPPTGAPTAHSSLPEGYGTDATGRIFRIGDGEVDEPVITSDDSSGEFDDNVNELDGIKDNIIGEGTETESDGTGQGEPKFDPDTGKVTVGDDPVGDELTEYEKAEKAKYEEQAEAERKRYNDLFSDSLAAINATAAATIAGLRETFDRRLDEQRRINKVRIDRTKAYGLGSGMATFMPMGYTDAVTRREEEAADEIKKLENERNALIAKAEAAARSGRADLLRQSIEDMHTVEERLQTNLERVRTQADEQYKILRDYRKEQEEKHEKSVQKMRERFSLVASRYVEEYDGLDEAGRVALIKKLMKETGLDFASIYSSLQTASSEAYDLEQSRTEDKRETEKYEKEKADEKRGELRDIGGDLYQVTYDEEGNPKVKLVKAKVRTGGGGSTKTNQRDSDVADMVSFLEGTDDNGNPILGSDGYMSPDHYEMAKKSWVEAGYDRKDFDKRFRGYTNPANPNYRFD